MTSAPPPNRVKPSGRTRRPSNGPLSLLVLAGVALLSLGGAYDAAVRFASERWLADPSYQNARRAASWTPSNSFAWLQLGDMLAQRAVRGGAERQEAVAALERSVELQPNQMQAWIALAIQIEMEGDKATAESHFLRAVETDIGFQPRWSLANFYLRQNREDDFWEWISRAVKAYPNGISTAADLCWRAFDDSKVILERAIPNTKEANRLYFEYLMTTHRIGALMEAWPRLSATMGVEDGALVSGFVAFALSQRNTAAAIDAWNRLHQIGYLAGSPLSLETGPLLANGDVRRYPSGSGFDASLRSGEGVHWRADITRNDYGSLICEFSGTHAEQALLLTQLAPVQQSQEYRFDFVYQTTELDDPSGIRWLIRDHYAENIIYEGPSLPASVEYSPNTVTLRTGPNTRVLRIELQYRRAPGTTRKRGIFLVREMALDPASAKPAARSAPAGLPTGGTP